MEKITNKKIHTDITSALRDAILSGNIPAGQEMTQNELAVSLGVSRMPVREALLIMEYQGLIIRLPNSHVRVADISSADFKQVFELAYFIEGQLISGVSVSLLEGISDELDFHRTLIQTAKNYLVKKTLESIVEVYIRYVHLSGHYDLTLAGEKLIQLVGALKEGKVLEAKGYLREYFELLPEC